MLYWRPIVEVLITAVTAAALFELGFRGVETEWHGRDNTQERCVRRVIYREGLRLVVLTDYDGVTLTEGRFPHGHYTRREWRTFTPPFIRQTWDPEAWKHWFNTRQPEHHPWVSARTWIRSPWHGPDFDFLGFSRTALAYDDRKDLRFSQRINPHYVQEAGVMIDLREVNGIPNPHIRYGAQVAKWNIPLWPLFVVGVAYIGKRCAGVVRERRRLSAGLCPRCGYDMRATPERCPECGRGSRP